MLTKIYLQYHTAMAALSVIIPTHKRADALEKCLQHLEAQTIAEALDIVVVKDVQNDKEFERIANSSWQIPIDFATVSPCQQGVARNIAVQKVQSSTCLLIGDDIFLKPEACETHLAVHESGLATREPLCVLGLTRWDPAIEITPVMVWLMKSGWQFGYPKIDAYVGKTLPESMQHLFTYTSNLSLPTEVLKETPFRDDVHLYGWEDIEWGMRLRDRGVRLYYEPFAEGLHHHSISLEDSLRRMETIGVSAVRIKKLVPEFDRLPRGWKRIAYEIFARFPTMAGRHRKAFLKGIRKGYNV